MNNLSKYILEKLHINNDTKIRNNSYFYEGEIEKYAEELNKALYVYGYTAVPKLTSIWIFKKGIPSRSQTLKNLICSVGDKKHIEWGPNKKIEKLEEIIFDTIKSLE